MVVISSFYIICGTDLNIEIPSPAVSSSKWAQAGFVSLTLH